jgi:hypothetical protein
VGQPNLALTGKVPTLVAGAYFVAGGGAPTQNCPDGTIYVSY